MTTPADAALAVSVLTAIRNRQTLGDDVVAQAVTSAARDCGGWPALVVVVADLADGLLRGIDRATSDLLADPQALADALIACAKEQPMTASDVGLGAGQVLDRVGRVVASFPT